MYDSEIETVVALKLAQSAEIVAAAAQAMCPRESGELAASIHVESHGSEGADVVADAPYALNVELGTHKQSAHPFLRPALDVSRGAVQAIWEGI